MPERSGWDAAPAAGSGASGELRAEDGGAAGIRLDTALTDRGLARSRTHAARLILDGLVRVDGLTRIKPSFRVDRTSSLEVAVSDHYVSRAAQKLVAALDAFSVDPVDRACLDVGASTGGFTQVLLERGARSVIALDVGHGQLAPVVRQDPRVLVVEGFNARDMDPDALAAASGSTLVPDLVVGDVSFISLTTVMPALRASVSSDADLVLLVKPQFEVGRSGIREGIVRNGGLRADAVSGVLWAAWDCGLGTAGLIASPVLGTNGNHEYLVHLSAARGGNPTSWRDAVATVTADPV
jgi:23S rRNA (cytidine1920-2'-O)/16S rRNA (cytidine1409-2'-O)-methyltransferase